MKPDPNPIVSIDPKQGNPLFDFKNQTRTLTITKAFDLSMNLVNGFTIVVDGFINPGDNKVLNAFTIQTFDDEA